jgi:pilus assembly protein CpaE
VNVSQLSFVVYGDRPAAAEEFAKKLTATGHAEITEVVTDLDLLRDAVRTRRPDAIFADLGLDAEGVLDALEGIPAPRPLLLVAGPQQDSTLILRAMRLGAKEFFSPDPTGVELAAAVERLVLEHVAAAPAERTAPVVAVMGAKGGVGATFVACQLAAALQAQGERTVIVDLNLPLGDVALHLDVQPTYTLDHVVQDTERLDATSLRTALQLHRSGLSILAAPAEVEAAERVGARHVERVLRLLRQEFQWVVLDVSRSWNEASIHALDLADLILLVTLMDVPTLSHARQHLGVLRRLGHGDSKIRLVANRHEKGGAISDRDYTGFLGRVPDLRIPNDYRTTVLSVNQGKLVSEVSRRCPLQEAFVELADATHEWCGIERPEEESQGLGARFRGIFQKKKD